MMRRVVVGMDGSSGSADALLWSARFAAAAESEVVAVTAFRPGQAEVAPSDSDRLRDAQRSALDDEWVAAARQIAPVRTLVVDGDPREALIAIADVEDAYLIVVGATGRGSGPGFLHIGSVAEYLIHHTTRPLAVIPPGAHGPVTRIALGVDGSERNAVAVRWTAALSARLGVSVTAVAVEEPFFEWTRSTSPDNWRRSVEEEVLTKWATPVSEAGVTVKALAVRDFHPAEGLLRSAADEGADLLVVGTRGVGGVLGLRSGGVAIKIVHHTGVPVVLVPFDLASER
jgi:nucleotide-binding universal stress UspA family protein